jgi:hypothetical protein
MNRYATQAQRHWQQYLPHRYSQIEDPETFFQTLGREVEAEIADLTEELAGRDQPDENYLDKLGRLTAAAQQAREKVLAERVLLPAEPGSPMDETSDLESTTLTEDPEDDDLFPQEPMQSDWIPTREDPSHPFWAARPDNTQV